MSQDWKKEPYNWLEIQFKKTHSWNVINYQGLIIPFEVSEAEYNIQIRLEKFQFVTL